MKTLSAVIITQDEERNIQRCIESLKPVADEIVVVDSGSTDRTRSICIDHDVRFFAHNWEGYSAQKNYAETLATGEWILSIDADEALSPQLQQSILSLKQGGFCANKVYELKRLTNFCGSWIHHCGWYPDAKVRLWQKGTARWEGTIHEQISFSHHPQCVTLRGDLYHYSYYTIGELADRQPRYYRLAAQEAYEKGRRCGRTAVVLKPLWTFVRDYLFRGGFLDGSAGFVLCRMNAHYTFMKYATLAELTHNS